MNISEWDGAGLQPMFGHQAQWIGDILDRLDSPGAACFAMLEGGQQIDPEVTPSAQPRRFLVATTLALLDARHVPGTGAAACLEARLIPWTDVRGVELTTTTRLDDAFRHRTNWLLRLGHPEIVIGDPVHDDALIAFWRACILRVARPPNEEPEPPEG
ncbi:MAG: hypothetical protein WKF56_09380 [Candidatus Limnocylindrales bacterium]